MLYTLSSNVMSIISNLWGKKNTLASPPQYFISKKEVFSAAIMATVTPNFGKRVIDPGAEPYLLYLLCRGV